MSLEINNLLLDYYFDRHLDRNHVLPTTLYELSLTFGSIRCLKESNFRISPIKGSLKQVKYSMIVNQLAYQWFRLSFTRHKYRSFSVTRVSSWFCSQIFFSSEEQSSTHINHYPSIFVGKRQLYCRLRDPIFLLKKIVKLGENVSLILIRKSVLKKHHNFRIGVCTIWCTSTREHSVIYPLCLQWDQVSTHVFNMKISLI